MTSKTVVQYTPEQTAQVVELYTNGQTVDQIAQTVGKSVRSIVAKLAREGVYKPKEKAATSGRVTKADLIEVLALKANVTSDQLASLEKASHDALRILVANLT